MTFIRTASGDPDPEDPAPKSFIRETHGMKTYADFLHFVENEMRLNANYQLVMLKLLVSRRMATKYEISEELAYYNNRNFNNSDVVKEFFSVPVYDVLEKRGFVKKAVQGKETEYMLNVHLNEHESNNVLEILENLLLDYNQKHGIPENEFDNILGGSKKSQSQGMKIPQIVVPHPRKIPDGPDRTSTVTERSPRVGAGEFYRTESYEIRMGQVLSNDDMASKLGVGDTGRARYSEKANILVLCNPPECHDLGDPEAGLHIHPGEDQEGDHALCDEHQEISESECKILLFKTHRGHGADNTDVHEFIGPVRCVGRLRTGKEGRATGFVLEVER